MSKTASVSLHGNSYSVDAALVGYRVELRYDPEDLSRVAVFCHGRPRGDATPEHIGVHVDPKLRDQATPEPGPATGISYLDAVAADHAAALRDRLTYAEPTLPFDPREDPHDPDDPDEGGGVSKPAPTPTAPSTPGATR